MKYNFSLNWFEILDFMLLVEADQEKADISFDRWVTLPWRGALHGGGISYSYSISWFWVIYVTKAITLFMYMHVYYKKLILNWWT